jgi:hypothetical protein
MAKRSHNDHNIKDFEAARVKALAVGAKKFFLEVILIREISVATATNPGSGFKTGIRY